MIKFTVLGIATKNENFTGIVSQTKVVFFSSYRVPPALQVYYWSNLISGKDY